MTPLPPWPVIDTDERAAVDRVLRSGKINYWTGDECRSFEDEWSAAHSGDSTGVRGSSPKLHSIAMANGSLTLDAALRSLGVGAASADFGGRADDEVIVSPRTYVASALCAVMAGARPVFAEVDRESGCVTAETLDAARSPRTRAVIPVHIGGWPCDMPSIMAWAEEHGIRVIEDCAQAHGATIAGRPVGTFGDFASWSFCQDKIMTTGGEGGMLCTQHSELFRRAWAIAQHGKAFGRATESPQANNGVQFRWLVDSVGTNMRMTEMQAAIGRCQLRKLSRWVEARRRNAGVLTSVLRRQSSVPLRIPAIPEGHSCYRWVAFVDHTLDDDDAEPNLRDGILHALAAAQIPAMMGSCSEVYRESVFADRGLAPPARLPIARELGESSLTLLVHHTIDEPCMLEYASAVSDALTRLSGTGRVPRASESTPERRG